MSLNSKLRRTQKIDDNYCTFTCKYADANRSGHCAGLCNHMIYCTKYDAYRGKGLECLDGKKD